VGLQAGAAPAAAAEAAQVLSVGADGSVDPSALARVVNQQQGDINHISSSLKLIRDRLGQTVSDGVCSTNCCTGGK
jgi:hypothetical protein